MERRNEVASQTSIWPPIGDDAKNVWKDAFSALHAGTIATFSRCGPGRPLPSHLKSGQVTLGARARAREVAFDVQLTRTTPYQGGTLPDGAAGEKLPGRGSDDGSDLDKGLADGTAGAQRLGKACPTTGVPTE